MILSEVREDLEALLREQEVEVTHPAVRHHLTMLEVAGYEVETEVDWNRLGGALVLEVRAKISDARGVPVADLHRMYDPARGIAHHRAIDVYGAPGKGIGPTLTLQSMRHLSALGYENVVFSAEPPVGRAYWARYDVSFVGGSDGPYARAVQRWFEQWLPTFGEVQGAGSMPRDFWRIGWDEELARPAGEGISLTEVGAELGIDAMGLVERCNSDTSHLGEALLLFGPDWKGAIRLRTNEARSMIVQLTRAVTRAAERDRGADA